MVGSNSYRSHPRADAGRTPLVISFRTATRLAGGLGQGRDAAMILVASAVEANLVNTGLLGPLGDHPADKGRGGLVAAVLEPRCGLRDRACWPRPGSVPVSSLIIWA